MPENRRAANSRRITLKLRKIGTYGGPALFYFTGGPGVSNLKQTYPDQLLKAYTVVEVGYRGIDSSPSLECSRLKDALSPKGEFLSPSTLEAVAKAFENCLEEWSGRGIDYRGYQIRDVVEDAEDVRRALGMERINVLAGSYGTRVALHYMSLHSGSVNRAVLVGANPSGHFFWSAEDVRLGFNGYQKHFEQSYPEYKNRLSLEELCAAVLRSLPRRSMGVYLDPGRVRVMSFVMLFDRSTSAYVFDAYIRAYEDRNFKGLALLSLLSNLTLPAAFNWSDLFLKGLTADYDPARDYRRESSPTGARFGSPLGTLLFGPPYSAAALAFRDPPVELRIDTPTLILNGELDFSTPSETARRELAGRFPRVTQWSEPKLGHIGDFWSQDAALARVVVGFLGRQTLPDVTSFSPGPVIFKKRIGLAHVPGLLLLLAIAALTAAAGLFTLLRRLRRRRLP